METAFPYVPGLLSFREIPPLLEAYAKLRTTPDAVILDGQGFAHPRRIGFASHFGLWIDRPTIGCAKSLLIGTHRQLGEEKGDATHLLDKQEIIGMAVRTRKRAKPVFVSVGHRIDLASSVRLVLQTCRGYRLPETTRQAHLLVNELRRGGLLRAESRL
jgi:deoxyribonuclease V